MVPPKPRLLHYRMNWSCDVQLQVCKQLMQNAKASANILKNLANKQKSWAPAAKRGRYEEYEDAPAQMTEVLVEFGTLIKSFHYPLLDKVRGQVNEINQQLQHVLDMLEQASNEKTNTLVDRRHNLFEQLDLRIDHWSTSSPMVRIT